MNKAVVATTILFCAIAHSNIAHGDSFSLNFSYVTENAPTFSLLEDRDEYQINQQSPNAPLIGITFSNGHSDTLILNDFYSPEDEVEGCHFIGHLANENEACVAMTGCIGSEDVEFTIFSQHVVETNMYKWNRNGTIELIPYAENSVSTQYHNHTYTIIGDFCVQSLFWTVFVIIS